MATCHGCFRGWTRWHMVYFPTLQFYDSMILQLQQIIPCLKLLPKLLSWSTEWIISLILSFRWQHPYTHMEPPFKIIMRVLNRFQFHWLQLQFSYWTHFPRFCYFCYAGLPSRLGSASGPLAKIEPREIKALAIGVYWAARLQSSILPESKGHG